MRRQAIHIITSLLLSVVILYGISLSSFTVMNFYFHQKTLAEKYCVNKDKPQLHCEGKCYLNTKLKEETKKQQPITNTIIREILWLVAVVDDSVNDDYLNEKAISVITDNYSNLYSFLFYKEIEHPPTKRV